MTLLRAIRRNPATSYDPDIAYLATSTGVAAGVIGFLLKDDANLTQGQVRETGVFLREDGSSGTVQDLDLVV